MKFGASVWPFRWDPPYDDEVRRIARLGFKAVELIVWNEEFLEYYTPQKIRDLRDIVSSEGLEISQFVHNPKGVSSDDAAEKKQSIELFKRCVDVAAKVGAKLVDSVSAYPFNIEAPRITDRPHMQVFQVPYPAGLDWKRNWETYVDSVRQCAEIVQAAGLRYSMEPHPFRYMANTASMLRLIEHVKSPVLGINVDPSHLFPVGEIPHAVVYQLRDRVFHCHFSDNDGTTNVHWRPGKGKIDWTALLCALRDVGFDGVISIELEDVPGVARGRAAAPGVYGGNRTATDAFVRETLAAVYYLRKLAAAEGIAIEWGGPDEPDFVYA